MSRKMSFKEQIKHPNWQKRRLEMLEKRGWKCVMCGDGEETLHVHHKKYEKNRMYWEYEDHELLVLCEHCHEQIHHQKNLIKEMVDNADEPFLPEFLSFVIGFCDGSFQLADEERMHEEVLIPEALICGQIGATLLRVYSTGNIYDLLGIQKVFEQDKDEVIEHLKIFFRAKNLRTVEDSDG